MSNKHLQLTPHAIRGTVTAWWYEEEKGISVVQEFRDKNGMLHITESILLPWTSIRGALKRKDKP